MKILKWYGIGFAVLAVACSFFFIPPFYRSGSNVDIAIYSKSTARGIAQLLKEKGIIGFSMPFLLTAKLTHADRKLKAGLYRLNPRMSFWEILDTLTEGKSELLVLKIPEGYTAEQIGQELEKLNVASAADFLKVAKDPAVLKSFGISGPSLEGFLFPESYRIPVGASVTDLIGLLVHQFQAEMGDDYESQLRARGLTLYKGVILASIVEKEAKLDSERPIIAGVLYNRLHQKMLLEVNATLNYVLNSKNPWFSQEQLDVKTPYNTYRRRGLPPTPICNPGFASLQAVIQPAQVPFLYYVAKGDGSHLFATTLQEHDKNIQIAKHILHAKKRQKQTEVTPN
jgi:UPF0755 protein